MKRKHKTNFFRTRSKTAVSLVVFSSLLPSLTLAQGGFFEGDASKLEKSPQPVESFVIPVEEVVDVLSEREQFLARTKTKVYYERSSGNGLKLSLDTKQLVSKQKTQLFMSSSRTEDSAVAFVRSVLAENAELFGDAHKYEYVIDEATTTNKIWFGQVLNGVPVELSSIYVRNDTVRNVNLTVVMPDSEMTDRKSWLPEEQLRDLALSYARAEHEKAELSDEIVGTYRYEFNYDIEAVRPVFVIRLWGTIYAIDALDGKLAGSEAGSIAALVSECFPIVVPFFADYFSTTALLVASGFNKCRIRYATGLFRTYPSFAIDQHVVGWSSLTEKSSIAPFSEMLDHRLER